MGVKFTPEQEREIARQRAERPSQTSFVFRPTPDQERYLEEAAQEELARKSEIIQSFRELDELLREDSIAGALRRAIDQAMEDLKELAAITAIERERLHDFFVGDVELTQAELERLAAHFRLQLVPSRMSP
jgi:hypothetical protein